ncbi:MAG TPA: nuclear transport factor 2 family protein [Jatrophihabitans sp.]|jgi:ketosteroid isomerase-like protein|nr:nuclear transport factor 2 family protein [Jatrophihabitans sp.]
MSGGTSELIQRGLRAWASGDLDTLESVFDPGVTLRTVPSGEWDCVGREELMWLLRQRQAHGSAGYPLRIQELDEHTVLVTITKPAGIERPQPMSVATRITLTGGKVSAMHQYLSDSPPAAPDLGRISG